MIKMDSKKQILETIGVYISIIFISSVFFILLFRTPLIKHINVFFYRGCFLLVIATFFSIILALLAKKIFKSLQLEIKDAITIAGLFFGVTLGWFILAPVTVERSISVFMLSYMEQNDETSITTEEFGNIFYKKYIDEFGAFDKRFHEQVMTGSIKETTENEHYVITERGRFLVQIFRLFGRLFDTEQWLLYPNEY